MLAKVLWLPPITAHCFRPQWATPDQLVLQCHPMHWAVRCINNLVCSVQCKCIGMCLVLTAVRLGAVCAGALVAVSDDQRGFNWSMASFVTEPRLHASQQPFHWKRLRLQEKVKICDVDPAKAKQTMNKCAKKTALFSSDTFVIISIQINHAARVQGNTGSDHNTVWKRDNSTERSNWYNFWCLSNVTVVW